MNSLMTTAMTSGKKIRVLILGGGFGGVYAAMDLDKTLATRENVEVTMVACPNEELIGEGVTRSGVIDLEADGFEANGTPERRAE